MNIYDISARAGVSIATVSRVINGSRKVSDSTRRRILNIIEETGYSPGAGRKSSAAKTRAVGILFTTLLTERNAVTAEKLMLKLAAAGYEGRLVLCGTSPAAKRRAVEKLAAQKINALIIQGADFMENGAADNAYIASAAKRIPIILLNAFMDAPGVYCALCDLTAAVQSVTEAFIKRGRRRPMFLFPSMSDGNIRLLECFKNTCAAHGIELSPEYIHICPDAKSAGAYVRSVLDGGLSADAAITTDDAAALAVLYAAKDAGLSLPEDFEAAVCKTGGISALSPIPLTSINCREEELCAHAAACVASLSRGEQTATKMVFPAVIVQS